MATTIPNQRTLEETTDLLCLFCTIEGVLIDLRIYDDPRYSALYQKVVSARDAERVRLQQLLAQALELGSEEAVATAVAEANRASAEEVDQYTNQLVEEIDSIIPDSTAPSPTPTPSSV